MTEFEKQVAEALRPNLEAMTTEYGGKAMLYAETLAPRVAAAITAARKAARTFATADEGGLWSALEAEKQALAALRALRGEQHE